MTQQPNQTQPAPFGEWHSQLSAEAVASAGVRKSDVSVAEGAIYWSERRPLEKGRSAIVRSESSNPSNSDARDTPPPRFKVDVVSPDRNVRSTAHEYGGACYTVLPGGDLVFVDHATQSLIHRTGSSGEERVLFQDQTSAYADLIYDVHRNRVIAVREQSRLDTPNQESLDEPVATLVTIDLAQPTTDTVNSPRTLIASKDLDHDFVATPRISPCGQQLAFVAWRHPNMPWDESELWVADLDAKDDGAESGESHLQPRQVAGGDGVSIFQPEYSPDGALHYVGDESGWWNLYRCNPACTEAKNLMPMEAEFALPQWVFGMSTYKLPTPDVLIGVCSINGVWQAGSLNPRNSSPTWKRLPTPTGKGLTFFDSVAADDQVVAMLGAGPLDPTMVLAWSVDALDEPPTVLDQPTFDTLDRGSISVGEPISFASPHQSLARLSHSASNTIDSHSATGAATAAKRPCHAFYYPPTNSAYVGNDGTLPPLIVKSHGGPTAATDNALDPAVQFWTSRGFGLVDVNYGGSTGYGRAYRSSLDGRWGVVDVEDCASAALFLAEQGLADPDRLIIRGGSAGGYTTLAALTFTDVFCAGASLYGIGDLETLVRDTHKFESRYLDRMIGPYPQCRDLYLERSPIHAADQLSCPVIFFQGSEDKVVPPNQSETMVQALKAKGVKTHYVLFEGEGHGFRQSQNIVRALQEELKFYRQVL